jgi:hypothetical protein
MRITQQSWNTCPSSFDYPYQMLCLHVLTVVRTFLLQITQTVTVIKWLSPTKRTCVVNLTSHAIPPASTGLVAVQSPQSCPGLESQVTGKGSFNLVQPMQHAPLATQRHAGCHIAFLLL